METKDTKTKVCHGICRADADITVKEVADIRFQPGCAVNLTLPGRENHRETKLAWIEGVYPHHILVRVDTEKGSYTMSIDKTDIALNRIHPDRGVRIKEVI